MLVCSNYSSSLFWAVEKRIFYTRLISAKQYGSTSCEKFYFAAALFKIIKGSQVLKK